MWGWAGGEQGREADAGGGAECGGAEEAGGVAGGGDRFLEGYLFDKDEGKTAFSEAAAKMHAAGGRATITISDPFCAERHREDFKRLIADEMDIAIGNADEWMTLYQTDDLDAALAQAAAVCDIVACTRSGDPVWAYEKGAKIEAPVTPVVPVDATGAGDHFAAGFVYGRAAGRDLATYAKVSVLMASEVIGHIGPRPKADIAQLIRSAGLSE